MLLIKFNAVIKKILTNMCVKMSSNAIKSILFPMLLPFYVKNINEHVHSSYLISVNFFAIN